MEGIIQSPSRHDKRRILKNMRRCRNGQLKIRYQIVLDLLEVPATVVAVAVRQSALTGLRPLVAGTQGAG
ncbi:hypothetical protein [Schlesneria sp. T3-172]|uniref:hypothetical protein n=1 Tax=Schlesneria sphaerica TaxID=3373610 RepID=UPI0037C93589